VAYYVIGTFIRFYCCGTNHLLVLQQINKYDKNCRKQKVCRKAGGRNNNEHLGTISYYPTDGILLGICSYLHYQFFNRLRLSADEYKMPAQQQAVHFMRHPKTTLSEI